MASASAPNAAAADQSAASVPTSRAMSRRRSILVWSLVAVATLLALASILTTWVNRQMLDNKSWENASTELIQDPQVRSALSVYLVNQLYDNVDVAGQLRSELPPNLQALAAPVAGALRQPTTNAINALLERPRVQQLFITASTRAQRRLVNVLEDKTGSGITTGNGDVTIDLRVLLGEIARELGLSGKRVANLPADTAVITIMRSDQLSTAQNAVKGVRVLSTWLLVLVLGLYALALYLAGGRRREVLRTIGWCFIGVGLIVLVVRKVGGNYAVNALTQVPNREPAHHIWLIASSVLGDLGGAVILYGVVAVLGAVLAGPSRPATRVREWIAPVLNGRPGIAWAAVGGVFLLLVLWGGTHALRTWWGVLLLGGLLALGVAALQRQTANEFPRHEPAPG